MLLEWRGRQIVLEHGGGGARSGQVLLEWRGRHGSGDCGNRHNMQVVASVVAHVHGAALQGANI